MTGRHASSGHEHESADIPRVWRRLVAGCVLAIVTAVAVGLVMLWPHDDAPQIGTSEGRYSGTVLSQRVVPCVVSLPGTPDTPTEHDTPEDDSRRCVEAEVRIDEGPDRGHVFRTVGDKRLTDVGAAVVLYGGDRDIPLDGRYQVGDAQRSGTLLILGAALVVTVLVIGRLRGALAIVGAASSLVVLVVFLVPALLQGEGMLLTSLTGAGAVMVLVIGLAHGINIRTGTAVVGTAAALLITAALAIAFTEMARLSGTSSEEAAFLGAALRDVDPRGLLLAGTVIGALGVLDDVTVTQVSAVHELRRANPLLHRRDLYRAAMRIGRDHIASAVNTLVLAYAGAALPLLVIFQVTGQSLGEVVTTSLVAEELVRAAVGSIGLVSAVPITTALAAVTAPRAPQAGEAEVLA